MARPNSLAALILQVPDLRGPKTRLRRWQPTDAAALAAAWNDPEIARRLPIPDPADEDAARRWIGQRDRAWTEARSVDLAVIDPASGAVIGEVGLSQFDAERRAAMIGWWIGAGWRSDGRAGEAVALVVGWTLEEGGLDALMAEIDADNPASLAVARRAGMRPVDRGVPAAGRGEGSPRLLFARTRARTLTGGPGLPASR